MMEEVKKVEFPNLQDYLKLTDVANISWMLSQYSEETTYEHGKELANEEYEQETEYWTTDDYKEIQVCEWCKNPTPCNCRFHKGAETTTVFENKETGDYISVEEYDKLPEK